MEDERNRCEEREESESSSFKHSSSLPLPCLNRTFRGQFLVSTSKRLKLRSESKRGELGEWQRTFEPDNTTSSNNQSLKSSKDFNSRPEPFFPFNSRMKPSSRKRPLTLNKSGEDNQPRVRDFNLALVISKTRILRYNGRERERRERNGKTEKQSREKRRVESESKVGMELWRTERGNWKEKGFLCADVLLGGW